MRSSKIFNVLVLILATFLGGYMIYGGVCKFLVDSITAAEVLEKANRFSDPEQEHILQKVLYISGSQQTGYFWQVLGICELLFGALIIIPRTRLIGAILLLPITLHILLFHLVLEPDELGGLVLSLLLLGINIYLVLREYENIRHLLLKKAPIREAT